MSLIKGKITGQNSRKIKLFYELKPLLYGFNKAFGEPKRVSNLESL